MEAWSIRSASLAVCLLVGLLAMPPTTARAEESYITRSGEAARAVDSIIEETGRKPKLLGVRVADRSVIVQLEGEKAPDIDEWQIGLVERFFFEFETTIGPRPHQSPGLVGDLSTGLFDRADIALDKVAEVSANAIAYAKLEDAAKVQSIEIAREVSILPEPTYGEIRWTIYLTSERESAMVRADAAGNIVGADLSNTNRARRMDLLVDDDWPKEEALSALTAALGGENRVREFSVRSRTLSISADHPSVAGQKEDFNWTISGVTRSPLLSPLAHGATRNELFGLRDVDLSQLGRIRRIAQTAWGNGKAKLQYMTLRKETDVPGNPELRWILYFNDLGVEGGLVGDAGTVEITPAGEVREINLPDSRRPKPDWLKPQTITDTLKRIDSEFHPGARYAELTFDNGKTRILAEDPHDPGTMDEFIADETDISRSTTLMPWDAEFRPERLFSIASTDTFIQHDGIAGFTARTYRRLGVDEKKMPVSRYTFAIGQIMGPDGTYMVPSPDGKLTLEVRVESPDGQKSGRVVYSSSGKEIDVVKP